MISVCAPGFESKETIVTGGGESEPFGHVLRHEHIEETDVFGSGFL
jgi:hypothetical protein